MEILSYGDNYIKQNHHLDTVSVRHDLVFILLKLNNLQKDDHSTKAITFKVEVDIY